MIRFSVTYEIWTEEDAEIGETDTRGFICEDVPLREALDEVQSTRTSHVDGVECVEADEWPVRDPRWVTITNGMEYLTGARESRSIHFPDDLTPSSKLRICRLLRCYGV